ncbi:MAG: EamA family transporter [Solirubrobacterales bacterium]|nr:EamA family transporter [Solirubrobacterales bacterium]
MSLDVLALVVVAAFAHAGWNLIAKPAGGGAAFVWLCAAAGTVLYTPLLVVALAVDPGRLGWSAIGLMAGSGLLHALYFVLLQRGYATGDLSLVYPLARGTGPLLSATAAIIFLGERPSLVAGVGAAIIVIAVFSLSRRVDRTASGWLGRGTVYALLTGAAIASYTLWDKHAVSAAALSPIVYYWGTNLANALLLSPVALRQRADLRDAWRSSRRRAVGVGLLSPLAYILILYALVRAPVTYVAPARESSIVVGTLLGALVLHEGDTRRRLVAAIGILIGVVILTVGY